MQKGHHFIYFMCLQKFLRFCWKQTREQSLDNSGTQIKVILED